MVTGDGITIGYEREYFVKLLLVNEVRLQIIAFCFYLNFTQHPNFFLKSGL